MHEMSKRTVLPKLTHNFLVSGHTVTMAKNQKILKLWRDRFLRHFMCFGHMRPLLLLNRPGNGKYDLKVKALILSGTIGHPEKTVLKSRKFARTYI